jgi:hypothetical protein
MTEEQWFNTASLYSLADFACDKVSERKWSLLLCAVSRRHGDLLPQNRAYEVMEALEAYADGARSRKFVEELLYGLPLTKSFTASSFLTTLGRLFLEDVSPMERFSRVYAHGGMLERVRTPATDRRADAIKFLHDIVGNPFRLYALTLDKVVGRTEPTDFFPDGMPLGECAWLTAQVTSLAVAAYDCRVGLDSRLDEARLSILADACEEAGCPPRVVCWACAGTGGFQANSTFVPCEICDGAVPEEWGSLLHPVLAHLRSPGPHVRGCWALDLILGKV